MLVKVFTIFSRSLKLFSPVILHLTKLKELIPQGKARMRKL